MSRLSPRRLDALCLLGLAALFFALAASFLAECYRSRFPGGWDGVAHFALADIYSRRIFPRLSGWVPEYFGGFPFPSLYPPMLYLGLGVLRHLGVGELGAYWLLETSFAVAVPLLIYLCTLRLAGRRSAALLAGIFATGYMVDDAPVSALGVALHSTFDIGESSQLPAFVFLLGFFYFYLEAPKSGRAAALSAVFLACVPLSNVHVVWNAALLFVALSAAQVVAAPVGNDANGRRGARLRATARSLRVGLAALLLSACWLVPMFAKLRYVPTQALDPPRIGSVVNTYYHLTVYVVAATVAAWMLKRPALCALGAATLLVLSFGIFPVPRALGDLALQPARVLAAYRFFAAPLAGWLVAEGAALLSWRNARPAAMVAVAALFLLQLEVVDHPTGKLTAEQAAGYDQALAQLGRRTDGRVLVEHGTTGGDKFALQALVGRAGNYALTTVFRESALDVLLAVPLRNSLSGYREEYAVDSKVPWPRIRLPEQLGDKDLQRLRLFNVRYLVAQSAAMKHLLSVSPQVEQLGDPGTWAVYAIKEPAVGYAEVPEVAPVLTFARFSVKRRPTLGYDFIRLGEEQFLQGRLDHPLALADAYLDDPGAFDERFPAALIIDYRYHDLERAVAAVEAYSRTHQVLAFGVALGDPDEPDALFARLTELGRTRGSIHLLPRTSARDLQRRAEHVAALTGLPAAGARELAAAQVVEEDCARIFAALDEVTRPLTGLPRVRSATLDGDETTIALDAAPPADVEVPVFVKQGYFPNWTQVDGPRATRPNQARVYLASPTFQLTFARAATLHLRFATDPPERLGWLLTLFGLALIILPLLIP
jgi:hypothetical protein